MCLTHIPLIVSIYGTSYVSIQLHCTLYNLHGIVLSQHDLTSARIILHCINAFICTNKKQFSVYMKPLIWNWDIAVSMATGYGLNGRGVRV
jgi:hypothetical protein